MVNIKTLIAALKQTKAPNLFLYSLLIGAEKAEKTEKFEIQTKVAQRLRVPLVGRREYGKLIREESFSQALYQPSHIKPYKVIEEDSLLSQKFGETVYGTPAGYTNQQKQDLQTMLNELKEIGWRTKNWMLCKLLTTGVLPVKDGSVGIEYAPYNGEVLTGNDMWSDPTADIIGQLRDKQIEIQKETGVVVDHLVISPDVTKDLLRNNTIKEAFKNVNSAALMSYTPEQMPDGTAYLGYISELNLKVYSFIDWTSLDGATEEALLPAGTALLLKKGSFRNHYGALALRMNPNSPKTLIVATEVAKAEYGTKDNEDDVLRYYSAPLTVPNDARGWAFIQVK